MHERNTPHELQSLHDNKVLDEVQQEKQPATPVIGTDQLGNPTIDQVHNLLVGKASQQVRTEIPMAWAVALEHIIADLQITKTEALRQSVVLFLRYHGQEQGVPPPMPPLKRR